MRIISSYKDYYDFVGKQFGEDPKVIYDRKRIKDLRHETGCISHSSQTIDIDVSGQLIIKDLLPPHYYIRRNLKDYEFKWIVIAAKAYLVVRKIPSQGPFTVYIRGEDDILDKFLHSGYYRSSKNLNYTGVKDSKLLDISRHLRAPVFMINSILSCNLKKREISTINISGDVPILQDQGFARLIKPFDMFQDIAYFMGNKINLSPDLAPPVEISDKDRIVQHGFDIIRSFRKVNNH